MTVVPYFFSNGTSAFLGFQTEVRLDSWGIVFLEVHFLWCTAAIVVEWGCPYA